MTRSVQFRTKLDLTYGLIKIKLDKSGHILEAEEKNRFRMEFFFFILHRTCFFVKLTEKYISCYDFFFFFATKHLH